MASIRRRKDRKAGWIVDCRDVPGGRRLTVATREEAELLRAKMIQESQQAAPVVQDRDITLDAYADRWLEQIASSVDPRTTTSYQDTLRLHIRPTERVNDFETPTSRIYCRPRRWRQLLAAG